MRGFWMVLHLVGFTLWIGGGVATMVAGVAAKGFAAESRLAVHRIMSAVWRIVVGPAALGVLLSGIVLSMPYMKSGQVPGALGLMMGAGMLGALIAVGVALPAAAGLGRLELDASGQLPPVFASLRKRLAIAASIAGGLALVALLAAAVGP